MFNIERTLLVISERKSEEETSSGGVIDRFGGRSGRLAAHIECDRKIESSILLESAENSGPTFHLDFPAIYVIDDFLRFSQFSTSCFFYVEQISVLQYVFESILKAEVRVSTVVSMLLIDYGFAASHPRRYS